MMWEPYCCLSKVCLEVVFTFSCHFSKVNHFQELRQQSYSFYLWNSEPNISSPLNTQAAQLWSNQEGITYIFSFLLYKWVPSSSFYFFHWNVSEKSFLFFLQNIGRWWRSCTSLQLLLSFIIPSKSFRDGEFIQAFVFLFGEETETELSFLFLFGSLFFWSCVLTFFFSLMNEY